MMGEAMDEIEIFTKPVCPYCAAAMADMRPRGVAFRQKDAAGDREAREALRRLSPQLRVPTMVSPDGTVTVGFDGY